VTVSAKTRFDVLKRDRFTCSYCGRTPPEVLLHVDHIIPRADGGPDDFENLTAACSDCNLGKGARPLSSSVRPGPSADELRERIAQAQAYLELMAEVRDVRDQLLDLVNGAWAKAWDGGPEERDDGVFYTMPDGGYFPEAKSVRAILRKLPLESVYEAIDITANRFPTRASFDATRYFYGVCWRMIKQPDDRP
jgi:hypothetical protein